MSQLAAETVQNPRQKRQYSILQSKIIDRNVAKLSYFLEPTTETSLNYRIFVNRRWLRPY